MVYTLFAEGDGPAIVVDACSPDTQEFVAEAVTAFQAATSTDVCHRPGTLLT